MTTNKKILLGVGIAVVGTCAFLGYRYYVKSTRMPIVILESVNWVEGSAILVIDNDKKITIKPSEVYVLNKKYRVEYNGYSINIFDDRGAVIKNIGNKPTE